MATNSDETCSVCANIDLKEYFRRAIHVQRKMDRFVSPNLDALRLGYLEDIGKRSKSCSLCQLIIEALCKRGAPSKWTTRQELLHTEGTEGIKKECYIFSYLYVDNEGSNAASVDSIPEERNSQRAYRIGIAVRAPRYSRAMTYSHQQYFKDHAGDIQLSAISATKYGMPRLCYGRALSLERVNMGMARDWLSECETHHKEYCSLPDMAMGGSTSPAGPRDLLVVDVLQMNLCRMPHGSRYIALSYCWPKVNTFVTTKSNVTELYIPGALRDNEERIFQAIHDAIQCVSELGERYLWVDALCIIQDDEEQKSSQIQQMDRVYGSSLLTLIHAPPDARPQVEVHNGLAGYRKRYRTTKQVTYQVQGMELLIPLPDVDSVIEGSLWTTRAWTFQEERLSRRKLYFTETQMYFQCSCAVFCEDSVGEGMNPSTWIYPSTNLWNSSGLYGSHRDSNSFLATSLSRTPVDDPEKAWGVYVRSLTQFSGRQMSDPRDAIASFEGILSVVRDSLQTDFWFGLPEKYLHESLLWIEAGPSLRRNISITPSSKMTFPSWSWAGWDTGVELVPFFCGDIYPEVEWFVISQCGEAIRVVTHGSNPYGPKTTIGHQNVHPPAGLPDDLVKTVQHQAGISESKKREVPRFLACWTCIVSFGISDEELELPEAMGLMWDLRAYLKHLPVLDNVGHWAGSVFMGRGWKDRTKGNSSTFEFMLLSRSSWLDTFVEYCNKDVFTSRDWCFLNVMLIQRDGDRAQRVGIGVIHEDAWVEANPVPMLIKLE